MPAALMRSASPSRQAEMEARDLRPELQHDLTQCRIERRTHRPAGRCIRVQAELAVVRCQATPPRRSRASGSSAGDLMNEEVDVEGSAGAPLDDLQLGAQGLGRQHGAGDRAQSAGLGDRNRHGRRARPAIGAWMIGCSMPNRVEQATVLAISWAILPGYRQFYTMLRVRLHPGEFHDARQHHRLHREGRHGEPRLLPRQAGLRRRLRVRQSHLLCRPVLAAR